MDELKKFFGALFDFSFTELITGRIVRFLYILAVVVAAIIALMTFIQGIYSINAPAGILTIILSPLAFMLMVISARVSLELVMVIFAIAEHTKELAKPEQVKDTAPKGAE